MKLNSLLLAVMIALLMVCLLPLSAQTRLKRFEIVSKATPVNTLQVDHPDCAVLIVQSAIQNLQFASNMGKIKTQEYRHAESRYIIFLYPEKQKVSIKCPGFVEAEFPMFSELKPRIQFTYEINEALGTQGKGSLSISSDPPGADILIDGIPATDLTTPHTIPDLLAMQYKITLKNYRYQDSTFTATVNTNTETKLNIPMKPMYGNLSISSTPNNARVFINDKLRGSTPLNLTGKENGLDAGTYRIRVNADRHKEIERTVSIEAGGVYNEPFTLEPQFGSLTVITEPSGAKVYLDGTELGTTNLVLSGTKDGLDSGTYTLRIVPPTDAYKEETRSVTISQGKQENININFVPLTAKLTIESTMQPIQVFLNGTLNNELSTGKQSTVTAKETILKVVYTGEKNKAYGPFEETLSLNIGEARTIVPQFKSKLVSVSFRSDLPYVNLTIFNADSGVKEHEGVMGSPVQLLPADYYLVASKQGYLDHYQRLKVTASTSVQISLLPKNATTLLSGKASLQKPKYLQATKSSKQQYSLVWDKVDKIDGYIIDRRNSQGDWENGLVSVSPEVDEWKDNNPGSNPGYRIYCFSGNSISPATEAFVSGMVQAAQISVNKELSPTIMTTATLGMIFVEGGTFSMGSYNGGDNEKPRHQVTVSPFSIGKYEVTQKEWQEVMGDNSSKWKGDNLPVEKVSWYDAIVYCNKRSIKEGLKPCYSGSGKNTTCDWTANGYRLPTEAEWEYAARGGNKSKDYTYSGSNDLDAVAWCDGNSRNKTHEVGTKNSNELGIYDMSGNVREWCWDSYGSYLSDSQNNPKGANKRSNPVVRGGSWYYIAQCCRIGYRSKNNPDNRDSNIGFRVLRATL
jgi:formylglycine-generating enzyme required for sulfatase activity